MLNLSVYIYLSLGWGFYFFIHSCLASTGMKRKLGLSSTTHRLLFNCFSVVGLLALLIFNGMIGDDRLVSRNGFFKIIALFFGGGGVLILNAAFKQYDIKGFLGKREETKELKMSGILAYIRHPIYTGTILITIGFLFYDPRPATVVSTICIFVYLAIGIYLEEKKLVEMFGEQYVRYKENVPSLIPDILKLFKKIT